MMTRLYYKINVECLTSDTHSLSCSNSSLTVLLDLVGQLANVGSGEPVNLPAVLDEDKRRHRTDVVVAGQVGALVHVHLQHGHAAAVAVLQLLQLGSNLPAGAAPIGHKVSHDQLAARRTDALVEIALWGRDG